MRIGIDIDGVLTDIEQWQLDYGGKFFSNINKSVVNKDGYEIREIFGISDDLDSKFWHEYLYKYVTKEPSRKFADEVIKKLKDNGLAKINDYVIGIGYGKRVGDAFYIQVIVIRPKYQHNHIGSMFMDYFIEYSKKLGLANIVCEGVLVNNKMNIENIIKKYNFKEVLKIKEYWGYKFPEAWCKECDSKPCKCTNVIFVKELN